MSLNTRTIAEWSHGTIGEVSQALFGDLGAGDSVPGKVELVEIFLGDDTKAHLGAEVEGYGPLHDVISKKLEGYRSLIDVFPVRLSPLGRSDKAFLILFQEFLT